MELCNVFILLWIYRLASRSCCSAFVHNNMRERLGNWFNRDCTVLIIKNQPHPLLLNLNSAFSAPILFKFNRTSAKTMLRRRIYLIFCKNYQIYFLIPFLWWLLCCNLVTLLILEIQEYFTEIMYKEFQTHE